MFHPALIARSIREIEYYIRLRDCPKCGRAIGLDRAPLASPDDASLLEVGAACRNCGDCRSFRFMLRGSSRDRSELIDIAQWLTLYSMDIEVSRREPDRTAARRLAMEAAAHLDEALKFFDDDNDLPIRDAFFSERSRDRFHAHPGQFSRQRLLDLRAQLPTQYKGVDDAHA